MRRDFICAPSWWENNVLVSRALKGPTPRRSQWSNCSRTLRMKRSFSGRELVNGQEVSGQLAPHRCRCSPCREFISARELFICQWVTGKPFISSPRGWCWPSIYLLRVKTQEYHWWSHCGAVRLGTWGDFPRVICLVHEEHLWAHERENNTL